ncbi:MAG: archaellar assembly protein FlaJ [Candidatus Altiarchaeales archaeon]|nr:archaellar assembly protein FlaJ [Candidatus Altiarchaeales archaeon]MBD3416519.1 archaellar assembly protein FlaJ [Candidatus Altiarchaeales archaeon]
MDLDFEEATRLAGYNTLDDFFMKLVAPVLAITLLLFFSTLILVNFYGGMFDLGGLTPLLFLLPFGILLLGFASVFIYPYYVIERIKVNIHENIHYFITYTGSLSTLHVKRRQLFRLSSQRVEYGEIAKVMEKVAYLADYWNLGLVRTCRKLSTLVPSKILGNFLDRMSAAFDFGERVDLFLKQEQSAVMEDYSTEYKQSLQTLSLIQDALVSLTIAVSFMMAISFMLPLIMGYSIYVLVALSGVALFFIDILSLVFIDSFITHDLICHHLPIKAPEYRRIRAVMIPIFILCIVLAIPLLWFRPFGAPTPLLIALSLSPLAGIGVLGSRLESAVIKKDQAFPAFIRSLGGSLSARGGSLVGTLGPLRIHEFGVLNDPVESLYARLRVRCDKFQSWMYFAGETGSNMIEKFGSIFIQVINLGGDPEEASQIISDNFIKLLSLRELRLQLASSVKGVYYGTILGVTGAAYATLRMVGILDNTFKQSFASIAQTPSMGSLMMGLLPSIGEINIPLVEDMLFVVLVIHAAFSAYSIKMVDGGTKYAAFLDFVIMSWLVALTAVIMPLMFDFLFSQGQVGTGFVSDVSPIP